MEIIKDEFPPELLTAPVSQREGYFKRKLIGHPYLEEARNEVIKDISIDTPITFLLGPTGVGKSTLLVKLEKKLAERSWINSRIIPDRQNTFTIEAVAEGMRRFDWVDFHVRALYGLHRSFPELRVNFNLKEKTIYYNAQGKLVIERRASESMLRQALEACLQELKLAAFLIDEAPHLAKRLDDSEFQDLMDVIKSLASLTNTALVLVGTYDLSALIDRSGQLCRRSEVVHFIRYRAEKTTDIEAFRNVLWSFQKNLPLPEVPNLLDRWDDLYAGCLGCVGILKDWLHKSLKATLDEGQEVLTWQCLERYQISDARLFSMLKKIQEEEEALEEKLQQQNRAKLRGLLKLPKNLKKDDKDHSSNKVPKKKKTSRVGIRKSGRDPIGGGVQS